MTFSLSYSHPTQVAAQGWVGPRLAEVIRRIRRWAQRRADRRRLMEFPDHMLHDIGISRSEIDSVLLHGRQGRPAQDASLATRISPERQYRSHSRRAA
jgi:uncharacterized protein YjiS (DUF1127 family)